MSETLDVEDMLADKWESGPHYPRWVFEANGVSAFLIKNDKGTFGAYVQDQMGRGELTFVLHEPIAPSAAEYVHNLMQDYWPTYERFENEYFDLVSLGNLGNVIERYRLQGVEVVLWEQHDDKIEITLSVRALSKIFPPVVSESFLQKLVSKVFR